MVVIAADHQINLVRQAKVFDMVTQFAAGDGHFFYRVVRLTCQLIEKLPRFFLHQLTQIFHHRCGELVIHLRIRGEGDKAHFRVNGAGNRHRFFN